MLFDDAASVFKAKNGRVNRRGGHREIIDGKKAAVDRNNASVSHESDAAMSFALEKVRELAVHIRDATVSDECVWFRNLLLGILNSALLDYAYSDIGAKQNSPYLLAWSCRNLLELKVITAYVLGSAKNAGDFKNDFVIDVKEFYEAITNYHKAAYPKLLSAWSDVIRKSDGAMKEALEAARRREVERGPQTEATDAETETYRRLMIEFGISENAKPKRAGQIARSIHQHEQFEPMFKVCSKIMHRTTLSIASSVVKGGLAEIIPLLSNTAACELLSIHELVSKYFEERGVRPPEN